MKKGKKGSPEIHAELRAKHFAADPEVLASNRPVAGSLTETSGLSLSDVKGKKKIVNPSFSPSVRLKPHIGVIMADAYTVIAEEFRVLRQRVEMGEELSPSETRKFVQMADTMTKLAREEREQEKKTDPSQMSDEDLLMMLDEAARTLTEGSD